jgi:hypothetical protein
MSIAQEERGRILHFCIRRSTPRKSRVYLERCTQLLLIGTSFRELLVLLLREHRSAVVDKAINFRGTIVDIAMTDFVSICIQLFKGSLVQ